MGAADTPDSSACNPGCKPARGLAWHMVSKHTTRSHDASDALVKCGLVQNLLAGRAVQPDQDLFSVDSYDGPEGARS
jgi:hypothetical protein